MQYDYVTDKPNNYVIKQFRKYSYYNIATAYAYIN